MLIEKLEQLECTLGSYYQKHKSIPQEALAIYITVNPRNVERAAKNGLKKLVDVITMPYSNYNPHQLLMSEIQKSRGTQKYVDIDFDNVELSTVQVQLSNYINVDALTYIKTRGGFHVLVELSKIDKQFQKSWYQNISRMTGADICGDNMIPIPCCYQGGFTPYFENNC